jgi:alcohol dehydrogenase
MKRVMQLRSTLEEAAIHADELDQLVSKSFAPNMNNNPVKITEERLKAIYQDLSANAKY